MAGLQRLLVLNSPWLRSFAVSLGTIEDEGRKHQPFGWMHLILAIDFAQPRLEAALWAVAIHYLQMTLLVFPFQSLDSFLERAEHSCTSISAFPAREGDSSAKD